MNQQQCENKKEHLREIDKFLRDAISALAAGAKIGGEKALVSLTAAQLELEEYSKLLTHDVARSEKIKEALNTSKMLKTQLIALDQ